ncbi:MAG: alternative ribosome rescue aminoacyl-tRNA hydrolase ArfB [Planctomycetota bacterium]|jgi:ribosome-associated protein|nr:alternative ribosome rescue aminoacyl-tRNA hydrolase ArfB [Planctomycetota bacterium]
MARIPTLRLARGSIVIPAAALDWQFARSAGPGGQHVNRTSSKAVLRLTVRNSPHLPPEVRSRLEEQQRSRLTADGELVISSQRFRDQHRNVADCLAKLSAIVERAAVRPTVRRKTKIPRAAVARRLATKRHRSETKRSRKQPRD